MAVGYADIPEPLAVRGDQVVVLLPLGMLVADQAEAVRALVALI